jgi:cytosine/adenosine deaminase-related metal-dependent hydrolase
MRFLIEAANATIGIEDGWIVDDAGSFDHHIKLPKGEVRPGLINAHDHLHRNHYGRLGNPPYANAYDWAHDIQRRYSGQIAVGRAKPRRDALRVGAWKNLIAGVTHVVHHDHWEDDFDNGFPLDVVRLPSLDSLGMTPDLPFPSEGPFAIHVAEGIDRGAAEEICELQARDLLNVRLLAVHTVGPDSKGIVLLRKSGCAIIWCPSSNRFLFGRSVPDELIAQGIDVLLGTDSLLTADGTLLDEIRIARQQISDERIIEAVGDVAARRLGLAPRSLATGSPADIVASDRPILGASPSNIVFVMANGALRVLEPSLAAKVQPSAGRYLQAFGVERWISDSER